MHIGHRQGVTHRPTKDAEFQRAFLPNWAKSSGELSVLKNVRNHPSERPATRCNICMCTAHRNNHPATPREKRRSSSQQPRHNNKIVVLAVHVRSLVGQTSTPHVACAPPTAHTAHRAYSDIAIVKIKLDSKATASKICVPSHNRWMIRCTNLDLAGCRLTLSIARGILGSLVMLFEAQHGKYGVGGEATQHGHTPLHV